MDKQDELKFIIGRTGDNLFTPFQCDLCHFRNLLSRDPVPSYAQDIRVLKCIRRANLDSFWARESRTVSKNLSEIKRGLAVASSLGFAHQLYPPLGPFPLEDSFGMGAAIVMLQRTLDPGKYNRDHVQFDTARKLRSAVSNLYHASVRGQEAVVMAKGTQKLLVTRCPTYGDWFERFVKGMHKRMGDDVRPDRALSHNILVEIMKDLDSEWEVAPAQEKLPIALEGAFYLIAYTLALRGEEVPMVCLHGIKEHWEQGHSHPTPHVIIPLLGNFKNEIGVCYHLMPVVARTPRGLEPSKWIQRSVHEYSAKGIQRGWLFRNNDGSKMRAHQLEQKFFDRLDAVKERCPLLINDSLEVEEEYGISRSFRRGATSEVMNKLGNSEVVEANGRWRKTNQAGAKRPNITIREHYTDVRLIVDLLLRFSQAL